VTGRTTPFTPTLVRTQDGIDALLAEARSGGVAGLDTEFLREKTYRARLCLVQVATRNGIYLLDPVDGTDVAGIATLVEDPAIELVVHAGRQDLEIFYDLSAVLPSNVFDVQIAAGFAGYGASLPYGRLVETLTKMTLTKGESYSDWCKRPLTEAQLSYAADDVRYLLVVADRLKEELTVNGRREWVEDEMKLLEDRSLYETDVQEAWRRVSGRGTLSGKQLAVLREVARWREEVAIARDIPRGWVVKDQTLIEIARRAPSSASGLKAIRGMAPKEAERSQRDILAAIERGKAAAPMTTPNAPSRSAQIRARTLSGLADAIVRSRCEGARVATELVTTRAELEGLLADVFDGSPNPERHRLLQGWRRDVAGDAVLRLARGEIAVRSVDRPPYIEEVSLG